MHRPRRAALGLPALTLLAIACSSQQRISAEKSVAAALISPQQEQQLGVQVKQQLEQEQHVRYVTDPVVDGYVQQVSGKILAFAKKDRPEVSWSVRVIDDPKTVNAFATPGGFLYVYSGLLLAADDTAELAGVMGHESGHVVARHSARQMVDAMGLEALTGIALGKNPSGAAQLAAGLAGKGAMLAYSRSDELEADQYGARYADAAGYDPHGIAVFFQKLEKLGGSQPGWATFLATHPSNPDRIEKVDRYIEEHHLTATGGHDASELNRVKDRLRQLPPPPEKPPASK